MVKARQAKLIPLKTIIYFNESLNQLRIHNREENTCEYFSDLSNQWEKDSLTHEEYLLFHPQNLYKVDWI